MVKHDAPDGWSYEMDSDRRGGTVRSNSSPGPAMLLTPPGPASPYRPVHHQDERKRSGQRGVCVCACVSVP